MGVFIMAAMNQSLSTRNYMVNVIRNGEDPTCRLCEQYVDMIDQLESVWLSNLDIEGMQQST